MADFKLVIFDVDGVIIDSFDGIFYAINETLTEFGGRPIGRDWHQLNHFGSQADFVREQGVLDHLHEAFGQSLYDKFFYQAGLHQERQGARQVLELVRDNGMPMQLSSACSIELTQVKLSQHRGLPDFFEQIHGGEKKSETFRSVMKERGIAPADVIFITDLPRDVDEALQAGIEANIAIVSQFSSREQLSRYDCPVVDDHHQLLLLLREYL